jgi:hypothetical protein
MATHKTLFQAKQNVLEIREFINHFTDLKRNKFFNRKDGGLDEI